MLAQDSTKARLSKVISRINAFTERNAAEKLYLHTDKSAYLRNDTLWLKAYLLNASFLNASQKSGILYIEIASDSNKVVKRIGLPVYGGLAYSQISLDEKEFNQGGYILRAYTNWMLNAGESCVFEKPFYIGDAEAKDWIVNYSSAISGEDGKELIRVGLNLKQLDQTPVALRPLQLRLYDDKRTWWQKNIETSIDGSVDLELDLHGKFNGKTATLSLHDKRKSGDNRALSMPFPVNRPTKTDLQFMPEGGDLIESVPTKVAFKAIQEDGLGATVSGKVYNSSLEEVASFESAHKGMGSFLLTPQAGERYTARVNLPEGGHISFNLPQVRKSGTTLRIENRFAADSCEVIINATSDIKNASKTFLLFAHARGVPVYAVSFSSDRLPNKIKVAKDLFPSGVVRFTLASRELAALNERIIFIDHSDNLVIQTVLNKPNHALRDSVALQIKVSDKAGIPVKGSFSLSVTDDSQVKTDSISDYSIINQLLLAADLKGNIEEPGYYEQPAKSSIVWQNLDLLLMTQGWTGFNWDDAFKPERDPVYAAEKEFLVKGKVTNLLNKPVVGAPLTLLSKKPPLLAEAITDIEGRFVFRDIIPGDTSVFHIQARNKKSKSVNIGIEVDEFVPPVIEPFALRIQPWYANIDTANLKRVDKRLSLELENKKLTGNVLDEVVVHSKKIVKYSKNLNGPGEADITINVQELEKAGRMSLGDLMGRKVQGFRSTVDKNAKRSYMVKHQFLYLIVDGIDITQFMLEEDTYYLRLKQIFDYFDAEEIQGIEIMTYKTLWYGQKYLPPNKNHWEFAFVEVTTRGGVGPFLKKMVGTYLYRPIAFSTPRRFYSPQYNTARTPEMKDIRSTIYWNPNVVTNSKGIAHVNFYTADTPGSYSLVIEGSNLDGGLGVARRKIVISSPGSTNGIKK